MRKHIMIQQITKVKTLFKTIYAPGGGAACL